MKYNWYLISSIIFIIGLIIFVLACLFKKDNLVINSIINRIIKFKVVCFLNTENTENNGLPNNTIIATKVQNDDNNYYKILTNNFNFPLKEGDIFSIQENHIDFYKISEKKSNELCEKSKQSQS